MQLTSGSTARRRAPSGPLQLTWLGHDALAWQPGTNTSRWNQLATELALATGIYPSGGYLASRSLSTPDGPVMVQGYLLSPAALLELPVPAEGMSPSLRWFCAR